MGSNRDMGNSCKCNTGFYDNGSIDCQPIVHCQSRNSRLTILANDGFSVHGKGFHFNAADLDAILGRGDWDNEMFNIVNERTGKML